MLEKHKADIDIDTKRLYNNQGKYYKLSKTQFARMIENLAYRVDKLEDNTTYVKIKGQNLK